MEGLNALITTLAVVFLPGILWARFDARYTRQEKPSQFNLLTNAFVFGLFAYVVTGLLYLLLSLKWPDVQFDVLTITADDANGPLLQVHLLDEIAVATAVALALALGNLYGETNKLMWRFLQHIRATRRYGDEDVWDFMLSSDRDAARYVNVRDFQNRMIFTGYIQSFSEAGPVRELLLTEVCAYNEETGELIFEVPSLYLCRQPETVTLEFPAEPEDLKL